MQLLLLLLLLLLLSLLLLLWMIVHLHHCSWCLFSLTNRSLVFQQDWVRFGYYLIRTRYVGSFDVDFNHWTGKIVWYCWCYSIRCWCWCNCLFSSDWRGVTPPSQNEVPCCGKLKIYRTINWLPTKLKFPCSLAVLRMSTNLAVIIQQYAAWLFE